jgi:dienelactone hydrolase
MLPQGANQPMPEFVSIPTAGVKLEGALAMPDNCRGIVVFAHGSGSSRHSPRNRYVAEALQSAGLGTMLFDLLSEHEEAMGEYNRELRFNIPLLAERVGGAVEWLRQQPQTRDLRIGLFGASTGAAAALIAAARHSSWISAVVSRGGRPDLAGRILGRVEAPTLLIVGGADHAVLEMNRDAARQLRAPNELAIVPNASHLFEERGALEEVSEHARTWFVRHLAREDRSVA